MDHKKEMIKMLNSLRGKHDLYTVFTDFIEMFAIAISNSIDLENAVAREKRYMQIVAKYSRKELDVFAKLAATLTLWLEQKPTDALGELFMELRLGNKWKGQFFTPYYVSELMARMQMDDAEAIIKEKGVITVNDPACGAGCTLIAAAMVLKDLGINYQRHMYVEANDIDMRAVLMCYIQLSLLGVPATVICANTLDRIQPHEKEEQYKWITPMLALNTGKVHVPRENTVASEIRDVMELTA